MKKSRFTEHQIIGILNQAEDGVAVMDICREHDVSKSTFYKWKAKDGVWMPASWPDCVLWKQRIGA